MSLFDVIKYSSIDILSEDIDQLPQIIFNQWLSEIYKYTGYNSNILGLESRLDFISFQVGYGMAANGPGCTHVDRRTAIIKIYKDLLIKMLNDYEPI